MKTSYGLLERFGVELEYMMVDAETLAVRPEADQLIYGVSGSYEGDVLRGALEWSNELALHVVELKTGRPVARLNRLSDGFHGEVMHINSLLRPWGSRLLPTAMHPWMNPARESRLWPHGNGEIYAAFDRLFNCSGHGWTNLQSAHLNLSFRTPAEFRRLHTAIRLVLPLLPALAASSPYVDGQRSGWMDTRLEMYRHNCRRIRSITERVVPDVMQSPTDYRRRILERIYRDLKPHDPQGILQEEWANARGAIARFERNTIEIRVLDVQECPVMDLAIIQFAIALLRGLIHEDLSCEMDQSKPSTVALEKLLLNTARDGGPAKLDNRDVRRAFGLNGRTAPTAKEALGELLNRVASPRVAWRSQIELLLSEGTLSERIVRAVGPAKRPVRAKLSQVYLQLADCLEHNTPFHA